MRPPELAAPLDRANFTGLVLGGGGGRPDYLQKLKVPEGSAISKPNFASKYSFECSGRDLQDLHLCVFWDTFAPFESNLRSFRNENC